MRIPTWLRSRHARPETRDDKLPPSLVDRAADDSERLRILYPEQDTLPEALPEGAASFLAYCLAVKSVGKLALREKFDMFMLRPWYGYLMILDYLPAEDDFRYRLYGSEIAANSGFDMTGRQVSELESETGAFFRRTYLDAVVRRHIVYSVNLSEHAQFVLWWHRVICPVQRGDDTQVVACNYPVFAV